ncbi:MAG: hypothetical protein Q4A78_08815 [Peptostreptococcaceae bacterium]|nr:hypothetical protein [Peptostreptococcaceae bacterium]
MKNQSSIKKLTAIITMLSFMLSAAAQDVYATGTAVAVKETKEVKFLSSPKEESLATTSPTTVFAGKGSEGDTVKISLFLKKNDEYILENEFSFKIESLGLFVKEIDLFPGENKIQISITHKGGEVTETRLIKYSPKSNVDIEKLMKNLDIKKMPSGS